MSNHKPDLLIFGAQAAFRPRMPVGMAGANRTFVDDVGVVPTQVSVETVAANLRTVVEQVGELIQADQQSALGVTHVDVNLAIGADGSVGLLGTAVGTSAKAMLTIRLAPRSRSTPFGHGSTKPTLVAMEGDGVLLEQPSTR